MSMMNSRSFSSSISLTKGTEDLAEVFRPSTLKRAIPFSESMGSESCPPLELRGDELELGMRVDKGEEIVFLLVLVGGHPLSVDTRVGIGSDACNWYPFLGFLLTKLPFGLGVPLRSLKNYC